MSEEARWLRNAEKQNEEITNAEVAFFAEMKARAKLAAGCPHAHCESPELCSEQKRCVDAAKAPPTRPAG